MASITPERGESPYMFFRGKTVKFTPNPTSLPFDAFTVRFLALPRHFGLVNPDVVSFERRNGPETAFVLDFRLGDRGEGLVRGFRLRDSCAGMTLMLEMSTGLNARVETT